MDPQPPIAVHGESNHIFCDHRIYRNNPYIFYPWLFYFKRLFVFFCPQKMPTTTTVLWTVGKPYKFFSSSCAFLYWNRITALPRTLQAFLNPNICQNNVCDTLSSELWSLHFHSRSSFAPTAVNWPRNPKSVCDSIWQSITRLALWVHMLANRDSMSSVQNSQWTPSSFAQASRSPASTRPSPLLGVDSELASGPNSRSPSAPANELNSHHLLISDTRDVIIDEDKPYHPSPLQPTVILDRGKPSMLRSHRLKSIDFFLLKRYFSLWKYSRSDLNNPPKRRCRKLAFER